MLAQNFLTAAQLGIPQEWHDALVDVLHRFERGEIPYTNPCRVPGPSTGNAPLQAFNMLSWKNGGVGCIGGWCEQLITEHVGHSNLYNAVCAHDDLYALFYPTVEMLRITVAEAAHATRNYLTLGKADWLGILELSEANPR